MAKSPEAAPKLFFHDLSDAALAGHFSMKVFNAAQKLVRQGTVRSVEYNPSDKAVYGTVEVEGEERNLDFSETPATDVVFDGDIDDRNLLESAAAAVLLVYRGMPEYAMRHKTGAEASNTAFGLDSTTKGTKKSTKKSAGSEIKSQLLMLSTEELADLILGYAETLPDVKRDLAVRFQSNNDAVLKDLLKEIDKIFPKSQAAYNRFSANTATKQLNAIIGSIAKLPRKAQWKPYWQIAQGVMTMYGEMLTNSKRLDDILTRSLQEISGIHATQPLSDGDRRSLLETTFTFMRKFFSTGYGPSQEGIQIFFKSLWTSTEDHALVIQQITAIKQRWVFEAFEEMLAELYTLTGNKAGKREMLERNLEYVKDFHELALYWKNEEKNIEKALEVAERGLKDGIGEKTLLLRFLQEYYLGKGDYEYLWKIFNDGVRAFHSTSQPAIRVVSSSGITFTALGMNTAKPMKTIGAPPPPHLRRQDVYAHPYYTLLWQNAVETKNNGRCKEMLELVFGYGIWTLSFYLDAEKFLSSHDAQLLQARIIDTLEELLAEERNKHSYHRYSNDIQRVLGQIYRHRGELDKLWATVQDNAALLMEFEDKLAPSFPVEYVAAYKTFVVKRLEQRSNADYRAAADLMKRIHNIMTTLQNEPKEWQKYLSLCRDQYRALRNFQKELDARFLK